MAFTGLRVEARVNKAGGFTEYWSAEGLVEPPMVTAAPNMATTTSAKAASDAAASARTGGERAA